VAAVDAGGAGFAQVSTGALLGRKVFRWGTGRGGRRWQDWLGDASRPYLEIQGGITETQMEHVPFPAGATWSWVESYGPLQVDPARAHGSWADARACVAEALADAGALDLEPDLASAPAAAGRAPRQSLVAGSGWGALEQLRRGLAGEGPLSDDGAPFDRDTITEDQRPWLDLLTSSTSPALAAGDEPPLHNVRGGDWTQRLGQLGAGWLPTYLQGLLAHADQDSARARQLFDASLADRRTPWALRALAVLELEEEHTARAADLYEQAQPLWPDSPHLAIETVETLLLAGRPARALCVLRQLPDPGCHRGRVRLLEAQALADTGDTAGARELLDAGIEVNDLREGENGLHGLWSAIHPGVPVPECYDFRMRTDDDDLERG
jgi:hypothetical protein